MAGKIGFNFPSFPAMSLTEFIPDANPEAINLMEAMLQWDPQKRPTAT